jgi:hypothetical protein
MERSMEMSFLSHALLRRSDAYEEHGDVFFISFPISNALPGPDKSGHRPPCCMIAKSALHVCPDLRGTLMPPYKGHEIKKDISILFCIFSFSGDLYCSMVIR